MRQGCGGEENKERLVRKISKDFGVEKRKRKYYSKGNYNFFEMHAYLII